MWQKTTVETRFLSQNKEEKTSTKKENNHKNYTSFTVFGLEPFSDMIHYSLSLL